MSVLDTQPNQPQDGMRLLGSGKAFREELCNMISGTRMFRDFDWHEIEALSDYMQAYTTSKGLTLFREGDSGNYLCLIIQGKIDIYKKDQNDRRKVVASIGAGKTLGEMSIIDGEPRSASAVTAEATTLALLTKENFQRIVREKPGLATQILLQISRLLSQRLRSTSGKLVDYLEE